MDRSALKILIVISRDDVSAMAVEALQRGCQGFPGSPPEAQALLWLLSALPGPTSASYS